MKENKNQFAAIKHLRKTELLTIGVGLVSLYILDSVTNFIPMFIALVLHLPPFPPFLDHQSGPTSLYSWIGYVISGVIIGRIAKTFPVILAVVTGVIYAGIFVFLNEYNLPLSIYEQGGYHLYIIRAFVFIILFTCIGGFIGKKLQKKK